jgi:hypothetical protein
MENHGHDLAGPALKELAEHVRDLQRRVRALEQRIGGVPDESPARPDATAPETPAAAVPSIGQTANAVPVLGKALLGIAGAYLLRALTEANAIPLAPGVGSGILYALFWLVLAARAAPEHRVIAAVDAATSVLILAPLLWENAVRFHAISNWAAAGVLVFFALFGVTISWRKNLSVVASMTVLASVVTAAALLRATYDLAPFTLALLTVAGVVEFSACLDHWLSLRWIVAVAADLAALLLISIVGREGGLPPGYAPIPARFVVAAPIALLSIYISSTAVRTVWLRSRFTGFEITQWMLAFLLFIWGVLRVAHGDRAAVLAVSIFSLVCGAACYAAFAFLGWAGRRDRNFYAYSTFGLLLVLTGSRILLSSIALAAVFSALGLTALWLGDHARRILVRWHGAVYLLLAVVFSGLAARAAANILTSGQQWTPPGRAAWISAVAALLGYAIVFQGTRPAYLAQADRLVTVAVAAVCAWSVAGFTAGALVAVCGRPGGAPEIAMFCPTLRTAVLAALALLMAWSGTRWQKFELVWLVLPLLALAAYRLIAQDLSQGTLPMFASLLVYGTTLVLLPRILQKSKLR